MALSNMNVLVLLLLVGSCFADRCLYLASKESGNDLESKFSVLRAPGYVNFVETAAPIPAREVGPVSAFALGLAPSKTITWDGLSPGSLFHRPKASISFVIDGVQSGNWLSVAAQRSSPMVIERNTLTSRAVHAVDGGKNLASHVSDLFHGEPLTLSMSADKDVAEAAAASGKGSVVTYFDHTKKQVMAQPASSLFAMNTEKVMERLSSCQLPSGMTFDAAQEAIVSGGKPVLSFTNKASASFLAEIASMSNTYKTLMAAPTLVNDNVPDVLTFSVSSMKDLHVQFGSDSAQVKAAMDILAAVIPEIATSLSNLYKRDAIVELVEVAFDCESFKERSGEIPELFDALKEHTKAETMSTFRANLPHIPLHSQASYEVACQSGADALAASSSRFQILCDQPESSDVHSGRHLLSANSVLVNYAENGTTFNLAFERSEDWTATFTMVLIVLLIFFLSTLAISYTMWTMDPGSDSIIYRMTSQRIKMD